MMGHNQASNPTVETDARVQARPPHSPKNVVIEAANGLRPGTDPERPLANTRLLVACGPRLTDTTVDHLADFISPGDLVVLNDAATLPASLRGHRQRTGEVIELRLASAVDASSADFGARMFAVLFGAGDWRDDTDTRAPPPVVEPGEILTFGTALSARVTALSPLSPRLVEVEFDRDHAALGAALYAAGTPVQYRHLLAPLALEAVQTPFAWRPWAMEMPSTGRPLTWGLLDALAEKGVSHAFLTHAAGLSATGDARLDACLPLPERYEIPATTVEDIRWTKQAGHRIIAVGTTVVRALEDAALSGTLRAGPGQATLRLSRAHPLAVVDAIVTGMHSPGESHFELLEAFARQSSLLAAHAHACREGYLAHELGDLMLLRRDCEP